MNENKRGPHSASASMLGYLYQVRYALFEALRRLSDEEEFTVSIERLDDVVFEQEGEALELLQVKHHLNKTANLSDSSTDLWRTIRVWSEAFFQGTIPEGTFYFLVTTGQTTDGSAAYYLKPGASRNHEEAMHHLNSTADSSSSKANVPAYNAYRRLSLGQRQKLLKSVFVFDKVPDIYDIDSKLKKELYPVVKHCYLDAFLNRVEGWWYQRVIPHLRESEKNPILSRELRSEIDYLREQFKEDNLPIDDDILTASIDASGYQDRLFVHQLRLIGIMEKRIYYAILDYFKAFEQRSRWVRDDLLLVGELGRYEQRLIEEWERQFLRMEQKLGKDATERAKKKAAQLLYDWAEGHNHPSIRPGVAEPFISRGSYQILSDAQHVGWHLEFKKRLRKLLEPSEVVS